MNPFAGLLAASRVRAARLGATTKPPALPTRGVSSKGLEAQGAPKGNANAPVANERGARGERGQGDADEGESKPGHGEPAPLDLLDPTMRQAAHLALPCTFATNAVAASEAPLRARSLEELLPALVRKIAWAGDRHKGTVVLELGAGAYAGTTIVVHADAGRVRVELGGAAGPELERLRGRLDARLRAHGLDVESVT